VNFGHSRKSFRIFSNLSEAAYEDNEPTFQLELIDLHCSNELRPKFKEDDFLDFYKCHPKDIYQSLRQKVAVCASLFGNTVVNKLSHQVNLHNATGWHMNISRQSLDWPQASDVPLNAWHSQCRLSDHLSKFLRFNCLQTFGFFTYINF
jgi:hypothetical protein